jgi:hypothetical protein
MKKKKPGAALRARMNAEAAAAARRKSRTAAAPETVSATLNPSGDAAQFHRAPGCYRTNPASSDE